MLNRERSALANLADREAELARLNERLREDSRRDPLTGMRNRRALADELPGLEAGHQARGESLAIALCDVDRFKIYNDELGHLAGDQALRAIAATIRGSLRGKDMAFRFGGEELLIALPDTTAEEALAAAERVRAAVEAAALPHPAGIGGVLTVSIGVAAGHADYGNLLARADAALYAAKRDGRNRVAAATEAEPMRAAGPRARRRRAGRGPAPSAQHARAVTGRGVRRGRDAGARGARPDDPLGALFPGRRDQPARGDRRADARRAGRRRRRGASDAARDVEQLAGMGGDDDPREHARGRAVARGRDVRVGERRVVLDAGGGGRARARRLAPRGHADAAAARSIGRDRRDGVARPAAPRPPPRRRRDRGADGGRRPGRARDRAGASRSCGRRTAFRTNRPNYAWLR